MWSKVLSQYPLGWLEHFNIQGVACQRAIKSCYWMASSQRFKQFAILQRFDVMHWIQKTGNIKLI